MTTVRIIKNWDWPDLLQQTPGGRGVWDGIQFTLDATMGCDYVVVLNRSTASYKLSCPSENVWVLLQEPPNECFGWWHRAHKVYQKVLTSDASLRGSRYVCSHPAVPWHVNKSYDDLLQCRITEKPRRLSWITSNQGSFQGHRERMEFLHRIRERVPFALFGRGFYPIEDKWNGLAPFRYSLAIENFQGPYYWTEKLTDCFLSWTLPIYYGCTNIEEFFPAESMIRIDIHDPYVDKQLNDIIRSDLWLKRRDAVSHARELWLNRYQFFPHIAQLVRADLARDHCHVSNRRPIKIPAETRTQLPFLHRVERKLSSILSQRRIADRLDG